MQNPTDDPVAQASFGDWLRQHCRLLLTIVLLAFAIRFVLLVLTPLFSGDEKRYVLPAVNLLAGHGLSHNEAPPYRPSVACVPFYPLVIAATFTLFGQRLFAVRTLQALLDPLTGLLVAFIAYHLAPPRLKRLAALCALIIYAFLSWYTALFVLYILTETLTLFLTMLAVTLCILARQRRPRAGRYWFLAGLVSGLALLTRPDTLLFIGAILIFLTLRAVRDGLRSGAANISKFCLAIALLLTPWTLRNYISLGIFQPLASEYAFTQSNSMTGERSLQGTASQEYAFTQSNYMPTGYLFWLRTWIRDETNFHNIFVPVFFPDSDFYFDPDSFPDYAYDSAAERQRVQDLLARYNETRTFTPALSDEFRALGFERIKRAPLRFFVALPLARLASLWLTNLNTTRPLRRNLRVLGVLPILLGGLLGFALWGRGSTLAMLLLLIIGTRCAFLAYHYAPEGRYIVELYPLMIAACGVTAAALSDRLMRAAWLPEMAARYGAWNKR